jgi:hypothetical protein
MPFSKSTSLTLRFAVSETLRPHEYNILKINGITICRYFDISLFEHESAAVKNLASSSFVKIYGLKSDGLCRNGSPIYAEMPFDTKYSEKRRTVFILIRWFDRLSLIPFSFHERTTVLGRVSCSKSKFSQCLRNLRRMLSCFPYLAPPARFNFT